MTGISMPPNSLPKVMWMHSLNLSRKPLPPTLRKVLSRFPSLLVVDISKWISKVSCSGCVKVVPERIYSMAIHPQTNPLLVRFSSRFPLYLRSLWGIKAEGSGFGACPLHSTDRHSQSWKEGKGTFLPWERRGSFKFQMSRNEETR